MKALLAVSGLGLLTCTACATAKTPEQLRAEGLAQECLAQRDRDTLERTEVDRFGRVMIYGRQTPRWNRRVS